jgi:hypothetical protein
MARILCLAPSGFGKTTGTGQIKNEQLGMDFIGLNPEDSYIISVTSKPLPYPNSKNIWKVTALDKMREGRRVIVSNADEVVTALDILVESPVKNVVLDDFNYLMQDWYMNNALRTGWDAPKTIGYKMGQIFNRLEKFKDDSGKNIIVLAHGEDVKQPDGRIYTKLKTTGKMVDEYVTPEGKFDVTLVGRSRFDGTSKKVIKEYLTNEEEFYSSPKSPIGMFNTPCVSNDLGYIVQVVNNYYGVE